MFTKQHYRRIAYLVKKNNHSMLLNGAEVTFIHLHGFVNDLCKFFEKDNPLFDKDKFLKACGL